MVQPHKSRHTCCCPSPYYYNMTSTCRTSYTIIISTIRVCPFTSPRRGRRTYTIVGSLVEIGKLDIIPTGTTKQMSSRQKKRYSSNVHERSRFSENPHRATLNLGRGTSLQINPCPESYTPTKKLCIVSPKTRAGTHTQKQAPTTGVALTNNADSCQRTTYLPPPHTNAIARYFQQPRRGYPLLLALRL